MCPIRVDQLLAVAQQYLILHQSLGTCQQSLHDKDPPTPKSPRMDTSAAPRQRQGRKLRYLLLSRSHILMLHLQVLH